MYLTKVRWGNLNCHVSRARETDDPPKLAVVLCHGYGAPGTDLVSLADPISRFDPAIAEHAAFIFPEASLAMENSPYGGRAWWPLDLDRLLERASIEGVEAFRSAMPEGLEVARQGIESLLADVRQQWQLGADRFVLGGFSQGAMLMTDVALRAAEPPALLAILSGTVICEPEWKQLATKRGPLQVLQGHGRLDDILRFSEAQRLRDLLQTAGASVEFIETPGYHEIGVPVLRRLAEKLRDLCSHR